MAQPQAEPYVVALSLLRQRLQEGRLKPGARITAVDLADELGLSTTPVREALSRLSGEGLVEDRRGQGYFVRLLNAADVGDLYRLSLAHLLIALEPRRAARLPPALYGEAGPAGPAEAADPVGAVEALFRRWVLTTGSRRLVAAFRLIQVQLGPVRRLEPGLFGDLGPEARALAVLDPAARGERLAALRRFHAARIRAAERLAALLDASARDARK